MRRKILATMTAVFIISAFYVINLNSRPEYSLITGNNCGNCHINPQGGGQRTYDGRYFRNQTSLIGKKLGFFKNWNEAENSLDQYMLWGFDYRMQDAMLGTERRLFSMQFTPYVSIMPTNWATFSIQYNLIGLIHDALRDVNPNSDLKKFYYVGLYPGQKGLQTSVTFKPSKELPTLKVGYFQPAIGMRYDDHTMLNRQIYYTLPPILPPDNSELGAEVNYDYGLDLQLTGGVYGAKSMSEIAFYDKSSKKVPIVGSGSTSYLGKVVYSPRFAENLINTFVGASYLLNNDYSLINAFAGVGLTDYVSLSGEYVISNKKDLKKSNVIMAQLLFQPITAVNIYVRYENSVTQDHIVPAEIIEGQTPPDYSEFTNNKIVLGLGVFVIPNLELKPEYRMLSYKNNAGPNYVMDPSNEWALQLHLYY